MIGIDTNILVRYLTQDDLVQAKVVEELFDLHATPLIPFLSTILLCVN